jgi:hypothetical protein
MIDNRTPHLDLPLPDPNNLMRSQDVPRLIQALQAIDAAIADRATLADLSMAIDTLIDGAPDALNTLKEIADAINDDKNFAATMMAQLALKASIAALAPVAMSGAYADLTGKPSTFPPPVASSTILGGIKIGSGLVMAGDGTVSTAGSGGGTGLPAYADVLVPVTSDGQTVFTPVGGYTPGQIDLYVNGSLYVGNGDDYTASNGTTITLTTGVNTSATIVMRKWYYLPAANAVNKTGDTMTGYLSVPANASGAQAPQVQEVVKKAGDAMSGTLTLNGAANQIALLLTNAAEKVTVNAAAATGTINFDVTTQSVLYYTQAATANWTLNVRGNASNTLNSLLAVGHSISVTFLAKQGTTPFYANAIQVDGAAVTPVWQGGVAPTAGNASSLDVYSLTIIKTGNAAFTVMASQVQFK